MRPPPLAPIALALLAPALPAQESIDEQPRRAVREGLFADLHELLPRVIEAVASIGLGDLDGDGDLDAFLGQGGVMFGPARNGLLLNDGTGRFLRADHRLPRIEASTVSVVLGDANGDGALDAVVFDFGAGVGLQLSDGRGFFAESPDAFPAIDAALALGFDDTDGDGDLDLYVARTDQDRLLVNDGRGFFNESTDGLPVEEEPSRGIAFGDVDLDGDRDVVLSGTPGLPGSQARLYLNRGGVFEDAPSRLRSDASYLQLADMDGDGDLDAAGAGFVLRNDGAGFFEEATSGSTGLTPVSVADVDLDGDPDLVTRRGNLVVYRNDGGAKFQASLVFGFWTERVVGDLDGDGDPDGLQSKVLFDSVVQRELGLILNDGNGGFREVITFTDELPFRPGMGRGGANASVLTDIDGDGDLDAVTGASIDFDFGSLEQKTFLFTNDGLGRFRDESTRLPLEETLVRDLAVADIEGDGDLDVFVCGFDNNDGGGGGITVRRNDGPDGFTAFSYLPIGQHCNAIDVGDVDGDGDVDALGAHDDLGPIFVDRLMLNDGMGAFTIAPGYPEFFADTLEARLFDADVDGDLDALHVGSECRFFRNDGNATFSDATSGLSFTTGVDVDVGDVDHDGDPDILLAEGYGTFAGDATTLYRNDGAGAFSASPQPFLALPYDVSLVDVDTDGDLDALIASVYSPITFGPRVTRLYRNDGLGRFSPAPVVLPRGLFVIDPAFGDVDGDGDADMLNGGRLWTNLSRQVSWRTLPRVGQRLEIVVDGPPETPFVLARSAYPFAFERPRAGAASFDPRGLQVVAQGVLDLHGRATLAFDVPDLPELIGATLFWQALVGTPPRPTNPEPTVLSGL